MFSIKKIINHQWLIVITILMFFVGLIFSRAILSISSVLIILPFLLNKQVLNLQERKWVLCFMIMLLPVLASYFWSHDKETWLRFVLIKLPLFFIPLGFLSIHKIEKSTWVLGSKIIILFVLLSTLWGVWNYTIQFQEISQSYLVAKLMPTVLDDDHVRFSWVVVLTIILLVKIMLLEWRNSKLFLKIFYSVILFWFVFYLHLLAAKTGLLCLYTAMFFTVLVLYKEKKYRPKIWLAVSIFLSFSLISYFVFPTLKNRVQYIQYDYSIYSKGEFVSGSNDGARVLSWKAGFEIFKQNIWYGVGFGDLPTVIKKWHQSKLLNSQEYEQFLPLNEWLVYASASGLMGFILFSFSIGWLIVLSWKTKDFFLKLSVIISLIPLIIDDSLEGQFGVFIFSFFISWGYLQFSKVSIK